MSSPRMTVTEWTLLGMLSLLFGSVFLLIEVALEGFGPFTLVLGRVGLGAATLVAYVHFSGARLPGFGPVWRHFFVMGALNNVIPFSLIAWGQVAIDSGVAAILNATSPLFSVVLAHFLTADERMTANKTVGVMLGFCGVVVLVGPSALQGLAAQGLGQLAVLGATLSYAFAAIYGRRLAAVPPTVSAAGMLIAATVMMTPLALAFERPWAANPGIAAWGAVITMAVFCTALAFLLYFRILATAGATNTLLVTFLIPPSALVLGVAVLGEEPQWTAFAGMALILIGLAVVDGRAVRLFRGARGGQPR
ncbi:MAG: DMT family transporter [Rhodospirillales bacterium]